MATAVMSARMRLSGVSSVFPSRYLSAPYAQRALAAIQTNGKGSSTGVPTARARTHITVGTIIFTKR
jgi:hypothetical protein